MEMDAVDMTIVVLTAHLAAGVGLGVLYFGGLWWNTRLFAEGGGARTMILVTIGRFVALGGVLTLASLEGAMPLLLMALGVFVGRFAVMAKVRVS
jgi:F1F0 ATPase subunit 2